MEYIYLTENAFEIAHKFVALRDSLDHEAGLAGNVIRNLFRKVDYDHYCRRAKDIFEECRLLNDKVETMLETDEKPAVTTIGDALRDYVEALCIATSIFVRKTEFLAKKAKSASYPGTSYGDFQNIVKEEYPSLEKCQETGDKLTKIYRELI